MVETAIPKKKPRAKGISFSLPEDLIEALDQRCKDNDTTRSKLVRRLIHEELAFSKHRPAKAN